MLYVTSTQNYDLSILKLIIYARYVYLDSRRQPLKRCYKSGSDPDSKVHGANMGPICGDRTQAGPMLTPWTLLSDEF